MITGIFLFLAVACIGLYFWMKHRETKGNHYRKKRVIPTVHSKTHHESQSQEAIDELYRNDDVRMPQVNQPALQTAFSVSAKPISSQSDVLVILYLMAPEGQVYAGYELLQSLLSAGLRFGKNRIFARHEQKDGRGDVLFYCAQATAPGTFDLMKMGTVSCKGLSLFFSASSVAEPLATLDYLLETLDQLTEDLGGSVMDENRQLFTKESMVKYRQQLRAIENSQNTVDLFQ